MAEILEQIFLEEKRFALVKLVRRELDNSRICFLDLLDAGEEPSLFSMRSIKKVRSFQLLLSLCRETNMT